MAALVCPGNLTTSLSGTPVCDQAWQTSPPFDPASLDSTQASAAFASGFIIMGLAWFIGKSASLVVNAIKKL